ncbi:MAG: glutaredoxin family protein [Caldilineaceae bacterium]|nr:glutaredoxin family protein [Caldilineaceae bacterium]
MRVRLYTKPGCSLCDELKADLQALQSEIGFVVEECNIEANQADFARFRYLIPVLDIEGGPLLHPPHDFVTLRHALLAAGRQVDA